MEKKYKILLSIVGIVLLFVIVIGEVQADTPPKGVVNRFSAEGVRLQEPDKKEEGKNKSTENKENEKATEQESESATKPQTNNIDTVNDSN